MFSSKTWTWCGSRSRTVISTITSTTSGRLRLPLPWAGTPLGIIPSRTRILQDSRIRRTGAGPMAANSVLLLLRMHTSAMMASGALDTLPSLPTRGFIMSWQGEKTMGTANTDGRVHYFPKLCSPRTLYFTWTIMTQFDILQVIIIVPFHHWHISYKVKSSVYVYICVYFKCRCLGVIRMCSHLASLKAWTSLESSQSCSA